MGKRGGEGRGAFGVRGRMKGATNTGRGARCARVGGEGPADTSRGALCARGVCGGGRGAWLMMPPAMLWLALRLAVLAAEADDAPAAGAAGSVVLPARNHMRA